MLSVIRSDRSAGISQFKLRNEFHRDSITRDDVISMLSGVPESDMNNALSYLMSQFSNCEYPDMAEFVLENFQVPVYPTVFRAIQSSVNVSKIMLRSAIIEATQRPSVEKLNIILSAIR